MKNKLLATVLAAVALFLWNALSWVGLGLHDGGYHDLPESAVSALQVDQLSGRGVYHYPGLPADGDWEAAAEKMRQGPVISLMVLLPDGTEPFSPKDFLTGFLLNLLAAGLAVYFLSQSRLSGYWPRVLSVALLGVFALLIVELPTASWYGFPADYVLPNVVDQLVGWTLAGLIIARVVRPQPVV